MTLKCNSAGAELAEVKTSPQNETSSVPAENTILI